MYTVSDKVIKFFTEAKKKKKKKKKKQTRKWY